MVVFTPFALVTDLVRKSTFVYKEEELARFLITRRVVIVSSIGSILQEHRKIDFLVHAKQDRATVSS